LYDHLFHPLELVADSKMDRLLAQGTSRTVNSIHHQGIKDLAPGFVVEAICPEDGVIEAIRSTGPGYIAAVQWHPELHHPSQHVLDDRPLLDEFLDEAKKVRDLIAG
jgi:putative glutamine amidotransferase